MEAHLAPTQPTQVNKITTSCEICSGPHDTQYCMEDLEQSFVEYTSSRNHDMGNRKITTYQGPKNFNEATNTWKDKPNFNWERTQTFMSPWNDSISIHSSNYQMKLEKALDDFDSHQEKRLSRNSMAFNQPYREVGAQKKGNQKPIKYILPKVPLPASIIELNKNPSAPKRVYFVNSIIILSKDSEAEEGETTTDITPKHGHNIAKEEVNEVIDEEESEVETDEDVKEILKEEGEDENFNSFPNYGGINTS
ncbi:hypothetical protein Tco_1401295 [Tanacetum coccineum]